MKIYYQRTEDATKLKFLKQGDWVDLALPKTAHIEKGKFEAISLGIRMQLPKGFEAWIVLRSSTGKRYKVLQYNAVGIIDESFSGPEDIWHTLLYAPEGCEIPKHSRIVQFRIMPKMQAGIWTKIKWLFTRKVVFVEKELPNDTISRGGLGSTGQ